MALLLLFTCIEGDKLEDSCECTCCLDNDGARECIRSSVTTFLSHSCEQCNVRTCKKRYPHSCGRKDSKVTVTVDCIERTAWYLQLIPVIFLVATIALLFYGFFIKTFDGYHPPPNHYDSIGDRDDTPVSQTFSAASYMAIEQTPFQPNHPHAVRRPSPLSQGPTIQVTEPDNSADGTTKPVRVEKA